MSPFKAGRSAAARLLVEAGDGALQALPVGAEPLAVAGDGEVHPDVGLPDADVIVEVPDAAALPEDVQERAEPVAAHLWNRIHL